MHDVSLVQHDLQAISEWAKLWLLDINLSKYKVLYVGNSTSNYHINDTLISVFKSDKILEFFWMAIYLFRLTYLQ